MSRIAPVKTDAGTLMMSLYGRPKTGKTRLAGTFPKPLLIIGSEDGTASVTGVKGIDFVQLERCEEIGEIIEGPLAAGKYASVALDNGTKFRDMRISEILGLEKVAIQKGWGFAGRDQWVECSNSMKEMLRPLLALGRKRQINLIIIAQEQNFTEESGGGGGFLAPNIGPALGKSVCDWINAECDYIGQTLIRAKEVAKTTNVAGKDVTTMVKTNKKEYCLRIAPDEYYQAGFRVGLDVVLKSDFIINPTYEKIVKVIVGEEE